MNNPILISGIAGIYSEYVKIDPPEVFTYKSATLSADFPPAFIWAYSMMVWGGVDTSVTGESPTGIWEFVSFIYQYTTTDDGTITPSSVGATHEIVKSNCTNVTFALGVQYAFGGMTGVVYFLDPKFLEPPGVPVPWGNFSGGYQPQPMSKSSSSASGSAGDQQRSMVVLYDTASGEIVHTHRYVSFGGVKHKTKSQIATDARDAMTGIANGQPLPKRVSVLHVNPMVIDPNRQYRVDPKRRALVKMPIRKSSRASAAKAHHKKVTRTRR